MTSRRMAKMAEAIREVVGMAILAEIKDPRVQGVTVTHVDVAPDLRSAKVHVSVMGDDKQQKLCLYGLESAAGFLQRKVGDRIETRYTPQLSFALDMGVKKSIEIARILKEVLPPEPAADASGDDEEYEDYDDVGGDEDALELGEDNESDEGKRDDEPR
jgi:ribosome-binding factor A